MGRFTLPLIGIIAISLILSSCTEKELKGAFCEDTSEDNFLVKLYCKFNAPHSDTKKDTSNDNKNKTTTLPETANFGCVDEDGLNYMKESYAMAYNNGLQVWDTCIDENKLSEAYCKSDGSGSAKGEVTCESGCEYGACVDSGAALDDFESKSMKQTTCYDADGGATFDISSHISLGNGDSIREFTDICKTSEILQEWICLKTGNFDTMLYTCDKGCENGACN